MTQSLVVILPIAALLLALILAAVLWYWWSSGRPETPPDGSTGAGGTDAAPQTFQARFAATAASASTRLSGLVSSASASIQARRMGAVGIASSTTDMIEVLRLHRDLSNGALVVQIGDRRYYSLDDISDPQVRRRFLGNAEAMAQFAQLKKGTSPLIDWSTEPPLAGLPLTETDAAAKPGPTSRPAKAEAGEDKKGKEAPPPMSMADEIEDMLQYRLTLDPSLSGRSIHIRSTEDGTIYVEVDGATFDGVGEVSDPAVRSFLQNIVRDWESAK
jgi:hypothetical protein